MIFKEEQINFFRNSKRQQVKEIDLAWEHEAVNKSTTWATKL